MDFPPSVEKLCLTELCRDSADLSLILDRYPGLLPCLPSIWDTTSESLIPGFPTHRQEQCKLPFSCFPSFLVEAHEFSRQSLQILHVNPMALSVLKCLCQGQDNTALPGCGRSVQNPPFLPISSQEGLPSPCHSALSAGTGQQVLPICKWCPQEEIVFTNQD